MGAKQFGARVLRIEDPALLTGRARFVDDIKLPGMLHGAFLRSPHPHALILGIDAAAARAMPGVHAVLTADDLPGRLATVPMATPVPNAAIAAMRTQMALARGEVCYAGEAIALVVAEDRYVAEDAAAAVAVTFEPLAAANDCSEALRPGAPRCHADLAANMAAFVPMSYGDVDAAFADAEHVFEEEIFAHRGGAMPLETRAVLASHDRASDLLTVWSTTQMPHICQRTIADLLDRDLGSVRVIAPCVGGGFGTKAPFYPEEIVVPVAAQA
jgi:aerobic carbon-monoxide dehydrogenase large subunit